MTDRPTMESEFCVFASEAARSPLPDPSPGQTVGPFMAGLWGVLEAAPAASALVPLIDRATEGMTPEELRLVIAHVLLAVGAAWEPPDVQEQQR